MKSIVLVVLLACGLVFALARTGAAQSVYEETSAKAAVGIKFSLFGVGAEVATPLTHRSNARVGFSAFNYSRGLDKDNIHYAAQLGFRTLEAHYDFFPWAGGFHLSPGVLTYLTSPISANTSVPGGQSFTLSGFSYRSDPTNPIRGTAKMDFNRAAPVFTVGWGNLLARSSKRFTVPFEVGFAYQGSPKVKLNLTGGACPPSGSCLDAATDPIIRSEIQAEQNKINKDVDFFQFYPIISIGFGFKL